MASAERSEIVQVSMEAFFKANTDFESYPLFVTGMKAARVSSVEADGTSKLVEFEVEMVKKLKYSIRTQQKIDTVAGIAEMSWKLHESAEMKSNTGSWRLRRVDAHRTEVVYQLELDLHFSIPSFVMKGLVATSLPKAIHEFRDRAKLLRVDAS